MKEISTGPFDTTDCADPRLIERNIEKPSVTVIVTSYNYSAYIVPCLQTIADQTYSHFNCIIVDDKSSDDSVERIESFISTNALEASFRLIKHKTNSGQGAAFKTGLREATGVFIVFVDADDLLFKDFLEKHVKDHLTGMPVAFTSSNQYQINEKNEIIAGIHTDLQVQKDSRHIGPRSIIPPFWCWATSSSMMFRKSVLDYIMPEDTDPIRICGDNYICHFSNLLGGSRVIPEVHGCYRRHGSNNFSDNPIIGGKLPTGDMANHPQSIRIRALILQHMIQNHDKFSALLSKGVFILTLSRVTNPLEFLRLRSRYPELADTLPPKTVLVFVINQLVDRTFILFKMSWKILKSKLTSVV